MTDAMRAMLDDAIKVTVYKPRHLAMRMLF
jgi:hypothetical protein